MTLLIAPAVAFLGLVATFVVVRSRYRERQSLYEQLRSERRHQIEKARARVLSDPSPTPVMAAATQAPAPAVPVAAAPAQRTSTSLAPSPLPEQQTVIAAIRAQAAERGRTRNVVGVAALAGSLALVLLGIMLAVVESHVT